MTNKPSDAPEPRDSVIIIVSLLDASIYNSPLTLKDVANAVQQDYFNYPGASAKAEVHQNEARSNELSVIPCQYSSSKRRRMAVANGPGVD